MIEAEAAIYTGHVIHKRLRPTPHALRYRVFSMLFDVSELDPLARRMRLFSHNRFNVFSIYDEDHGPGDGTPIIEVARQCLSGAGRPSEGRRIGLLCYPRIFGYVFNPLSVYYVYAPDGTLETLIYEVNNTFGERTSYVVAAGAPQVGGVFAHACAKCMYVSPFTEGRGDYAFRVSDPDREALVAVLLRDGAGAVLKTHFRGTRESLSDARILALLVRYPFLTLKIMTAIHVEALKLWLKGVPQTERHTSPRFASTPAKSTEHSATLQGPV